MKQQYMISKLSQNKKSKLSKSPQTPLKPLIKNKKAMKKIVAKHEDVMSFFEKIKIKKQ